MTTTADRSAAPRDPARKPPDDAADRTIVMPPVPATLPEDDPTEVNSALEGEHAEFRPTTGGWVARGLVWAFLAWVVLAFPVNFLSPFEVGVADIDTASLAAIYAIGGLSLNVLLGYCGQISFGHQAFVGIGAFASAYIVSDLQLSFWLAIAVAALFGGVQAALLGAVSLRLTGLYFALVTLAYGTFAQETLFGIATITGGEGGKPAPRPELFTSGYRYYFVCLGFLALVLWLDWRLTSSRAGRAMAALRENPRVASSYGIDVRAYILVAFTVSGIFAGIAGSLMAHHDEVIVGSSFDFRLALLFILMTVVGGLRNRVGVVIGSVFFALLEEGALVDMFRLEGFFEGFLDLPTEFVALVVGPILLVLTLTLYPGGIGQQVAPIRGWLAGRRFDRHAGATQEVEVSDVRA
ncbi:branched-chain amino acid ABC transporter permease [Nocardioides sp. GCM10027113]|uniref:branched-chain amino acid ABC transporter permease n=1 Tax=unclassified Nocardioides TaxID=2615069 RepID=UPI003606DCD2